MISFIKRLFKRQPKSFIKDVKRKSQQSNDYLDQWKYNDDPILSGNKWQTAGGEILHLEDMSTQHIFNCLQIVKDIDDYQMEGTITPDGSDVDYWEDVNLINGKLPSEWVEIFKIELKRRKKNEIKGVITCDTSKIGRSLI